VPAIGAQRGKKAKPVLRIGKVVADVQRDYDAARQRKQSRAAERQYRSQGAAVPRVAARQRDAAVTRRGLEAERQYRSQARAVKLVADPHARRAASRAAELRQMRARSRAQERSYRSLANQINVAAQLQGQVGRLQRRAQTTTSEPVRAFGVKLPGQKPHPLLGPSDQRSLKGEKRAFSARGKTSGELAELISRIDKKDPHKFDRAVRDLQGEATVKASQELSGPARKVLSVATRPLNATAGAASAALRGKGAGEIAKSGWKGLTSGKEKDRKLFSTVLKEHGVKGPTGSLLGFALDDRLRRPLRRQARPRRHARHRRRRAPRRQGPGTQDGRQAQDRGAQGRRRSQRDAARRRADDRQGSDARVTDEREGPAARDSSGI
jgi:hypothetical protein